MILHRISSFGLLQHNYGVLSIVRVRCKFFQLKVHFQILFLFFAEETKRKIKNDIYATERFRVIGMLKNAPDFSNDFQCSKSSRMNRHENKCDIWWNITLLKSSYKVYWKSFKTNRSKGMAMTWKVELSERRFIEMAISSEFFRRFAPKFTWSCNWCSTLSLTYFHCIFHRECNKALLKPFMTFITH